MNYKNSLLILIIALMANSCISGMKPEKEEQSAPSLDASVVAQIPYTVIQNKSSWKLHVAYRPKSSQTTIEKVLVPQESVTVLENPEDILSFTVCPYGAWKKMLGQLSMEDLSVKMLVSIPREHGGITVTINDPTEPSALSFLRACAEYIAPSATEKVGDACQSFTQTFFPFRYEYSPLPVGQVLAAPALPASGNPLDAFPNVVYAKKQDKTPTPYQILGIPKGASTESVNEAFIALDRYWEAAKLQYAPNTHEHNLIQQIIEFVVKARTAMILMNELETYKTQNN